MAFNPSKLVLGTTGQTTSALTANLGGAPDYFSFMAAGMIAIMVLNLSIRGMTSLVFDRYLGFLDKLLASPIRRESVLASKVLAGTARGVIQALALLVIAVLLGMKFGPAFGVLQFLLLLATLIMLGFGLSTVFVCLGIRIKRWETQEAIATAVTFPIMFTSSALYPVQTMPSWLQPIALINPITYTIQILRDLIYGNYSTTTQFLSLQNSVAIMGLFTLASVGALIVFSRWLSSSR